MTATDQTLDRFWQLAVDCRLDDAPFWQPPNSLSWLDCPSCRDRSLVDAAQNKLQCQRCQRWFSTLGMERLITQPLTRLSEQERGRIERELIARAMLRRARKIVNEEPIMNADRMILGMFTTTGERP